MRLSAGSGSNHDDWSSGIAFGVLDLSGPSRKVFNEALSWVAQIADPFHVVRAAKQRLGESRRRVQNETLDNRGRGDPLYGIRRLLTMAVERLDHDGSARLSGRLAEGDPHDEVQSTYQAKEAVRDIYRITDHTTAVEVVDELPELMADNTFPPEVRRLGQMLARSR